MTAEEQIAVIKAQEEGKTVQFRPISEAGRRTYADRWHDPTESVYAWRQLGKNKFNFASYDYRVKPEEPKKWRATFLYQEGTTGSTSYIYKSAKEAAEIAGVYYPNLIKIERQP